MIAKNNTARRHHYVPQFILRNFVNDNRKLYCSRMGSDSIFEVSPQKIFAENNLYTETLDDGTRSTTTETKLSQFEGSLSTVVRKIIEDSQSYVDIVLSPLEEELLRKFFDIQILRHPSQRDMIHTHFGTQSLQAEIERQLNRPMNSIERDLFYAPNPNRADSVFTTSIDSSENNPGSFLNALQERRIGIVRLRQNAGELVIGDKPFIPISPRNGCMNSMSSGDWLLYPISWNVGVMWGLEDGDEKLKSFADPQWAFDINQQIFRQSQIIAGRSKNVIRSILDLAK